jgi:hypothetical protein
VIMENTCKNCGHFALMCPAGDECLWGVCKKTAANNAEEQMNGKKEVVFKWAEDVCSEFATRRKTASHHLQKWLEPLKKMLKI